MSETGRRPRLRSAVASAALLVTTVLLASCASGDPGVDAVVEDLEQQLASRVVPELSDNGLVDATWDTFHAVLADVRTEDLHVTRASNAGGSSGEGAGEPATIESVVTIVGPQRGACVAVSVSGAGAVRSVRVVGDPAENCEGAQVPDASL